MTCSLASLSKERPALIFNAKCEGCEKRPLSSQFYLCLLCESYFLCSTCSQNKFISKSHFVSHPKQLVLTTSIASNFTSTSFNSIPCTSQESYACPLCSIENLTRQNFLEHAKTTHLEDKSQVYCPICLGPYRCRLSEHVEKVHSVRPLLNPFSPTITSKMKLPNLIPPQIPPPIGTGTVAPSSALGTGVFTNFGSSNWLNSMLKDDFGINSSLQRITGILPEPPLLAPIGITEEDVKNANHHYYILKNMCDALNSLVIVVGKSHDAAMVILTFVDKLLDFHQMKGFRQQMIWDACQNKSIFTGLSMPPFIDTNKLSSSLVNRFTLQKQILFPLDQPNNQIIWDKNECLGLLDGKARELNEANKCSIDTDSEEVNKEDLIRSIFDILIPEPYNKIDSFSH